MALVQEHVTTSTSAYVDALAAGTVVAGVRGSLWWDRRRGVEQISDLVEQRRR